MQKSIEQLRCTLFLGSKCEDLKEAGYNPQKSDQLIGPLFVLNFVNTKVPGDEPGSVTVQDKLSLLSIYIRRNNEGIPPKLKFGKKAGYLSFRYRKCLKT